MGITYCGDREVTYTRATRKVVDSLVKEKRVHFDSMWVFKCDSIVDNFIAINMDSLLEDRRAEIIKIMEAE